MVVYSHALYTLSEYAHAVYAWYYMTNSRPTKDLFSKGVRKIMVAMKGKYISHSANPLKSKKSI